MMQSRFKHESGNLFIVSNEENKIILIDWNKDPKLPVSEKLDDLHKKAHQQFVLYFKKELKQFDLPILVKGTPFQEKVWKYLLKVKYGKVAHYSDIAVAIGHPEAVRAVGSAVGKNPLGILIPCHRIVPKSGKLGGFGGGPSIKKYLLSHEGYTF